MKMGIARRFAKNALLQIGVNITTKLVALVLAVYLTFILDPENFGMYSWIIAIALMLDMFANFGTGNAISKFAAPAAMENRQKTFAAYFKYLFKIRLIALAIIVILVMLFAEFIATFVFSKPFLAFPLRLSALFLIAYSISGYLQAAFVTMQRMEFVFGAMLAQAILKLALVISLALLTKSFIGGIAGYIAAIAVAAFVLFFIIARKYGFLLKLNGAVDKKALFPYLGFAVSADFIFILLASMDVLMVSALLPIENVGFYSIAMSWSSAIAGMIPVYMLFPVFSELAAKPLAHLREAFRHFFKYALFLMVPVAFLLAYFSDFLVKFLYRGAYAAAASQVLFVLSFLIMFSALMVFLMLLYNAIGRPDVPTKIYGAVLVYDIIANYVLITTFGLIGAAYATLSSYILLCAAFLLLLKPIAKIQFSASAIIKPLLASGVVFFALLQFPKPANLAIAIAYFAFAGIAYFIIQLAIKGISTSELKYLKSRILKQG